MFKPIESVYLSPKTSIQVQTNNTNKDSLDDLITQRIASFRNELNNKHDNAIKGINSYKEMYDELKNISSRSENEYFYYWFDKEETEKKIII